jgi:hypothetical protein
LTLPNFIFNNCAVTVIQNVSNCTIYLGSSGAKIVPNKTQQTLEERVAQSAVIDDPPPVKTMSQKLKELPGKKLKDSVNPNNPWNDIYVIDDYFDDEIITSSSSSTQTIKEWVVVKEGDSKNVGKFIKWLEDDKGMTGVKSLDPIPLDIETLWDDFESSF